MLLPPTFTASDSGRSRDAAAVWAGHLAHVALDLLALPVGVGFGCGAAAATARLLRTGCRSCARCRSGCGTEHARGGCRRRRGRSCAVALVSLDQALSMLKPLASATAFSTREKYSVRAPAQGAIAPLDKREIRVRHDQIGIDLEARAETVARRARPERRVEGEAARRQLVERDAAVNARQVLGEGEHLSPSAAPRVRRYRPHRRRLPWRRGLAASLFLPALRGGPP